MLLVVFDYLKTLNKIFMWKYCRKPKEIISTFIYVYLYIMSVLKSGI